MSFTVEFVSPEALLYSGQATQVVCRTRGGGDIAFMPGHEPFIGSLQPCEVRVTEESGDVQRFAVRGGFVSVAGATTTVLSDAAIPAADIDVAAAEADRAAAAAAVSADAGARYAAMVEATARLAGRWDEMSQIVEGR